MTTEAVNGTRQVTNHIVMVRPVAFYFNAQTAANDFFQKNLHEPPGLVQARALREFDALVAKLRAAGVTVAVLQDVDPPCATPDSIFPNNWFVSFDDNTLVLCPMYAENRRAERGKFLGGLVAACGCDRLSILDYTRHEQQGRFLEGTGAMVLDRIQRKAYCCLSDRADADLFAAFCREFAFTPVAFHGFQSLAGRRVPIYHTNVMMALGERYGVICLDAIDDPAERAAVVAAVEASGREIIPIAEEQVDRFAGNEIELEGAQGKRYTVISASTFACLTEAQKGTLSRYTEIISADVMTIETYGGGSVRCMISEVFAWPQR